MFVFNAEAVNTVIENTPFETGIKKAVIVGAFLTESKKGNNMLNLRIGNKVGDAGFGLKAFCIDEKWASGKQNFDHGKFNELANICGMATGATTEVTVKNFGKDVQVQQFDELIGKECTFALQTSFDYYEAGSRVNEDLNLYATFTADGKSATERDGNKPAKRVAKLEDRLVDFITPAYQTWVDAGSPVATDDAEEDIGGLI